MDKFKYEKIVNKLFSDLDSLKESLEVVLSRQYLDENLLDDLSVNVSNKISYINQFKVGLSTDCKFYSGFQEISNEYTILRNELKSNRNELKSNYNNFKEERIINEYDQ